MKRRESILVRCGGESHHLQLGKRDILVLSNQFHIPNAWVYKKALGFYCARGMKPPPEDVVLLTHEKSEFAAHMNLLKQDLDRQDGMLGWNYAYEFGDEPGVRNGGGWSGFRVRGLYASISTRPAGYCDLELSALRNGKLVFAELIDMRVVGSIETDNKGYIKIHRKRVPFLWDEGLVRLLAFLRAAPGNGVDILHSHIPEE